MPAKKSSSLNRRDVLKGTAATVTAGIAFGLPGTALAETAAQAVVEQGAAQKSTGLLSHALCKAHHKEMAKHLTSVLNASYVEERMADVALTTTSECAHCRSPIEPGMKTRAAFSTLK
ncbi:MAG: twin-arginine translocation signal domain-containing protein [Pseudomonadota bacterium]